MVQGFYGVSGERPSGIELAWEEKRNGDVVLHVKFPDKVAGPYLRSLTPEEAKLFVECTMEGFQAGARAVKRSRNPPTDPKTLLFGDRSPIRGE